MAGSREFKIKIDGIDKTIDDIKTLREELDKNLAASNIEELEHNLKVLEEAYKSLNQTERDSAIGTQLLGDIQRYNTALQESTIALNDHKEKLKTFTIKIDGVDKTITDITTLREELDKSANSSSVADLTHNLKTLEEAYNSLDRAAQEGDTGQKLLQDIEEYQSTLRAATSALREQNEEVEKTFALRETEQGSIEQLKLLIKQLTEEYEGLSEAERKVSGTELISRIQTLQEELSNLETMSKSHLAIFGSLGETLNTISEGFTNANSTISSFSGILSSSSDVLKLFGVESRTLTQAVEKLGEITKTVSTIQSLYTQLVSKDSIVMKAAAVAKNLFTKSTQGSSVALKGFKAALISTGVGAFIVLLGYLIANFDDIKKQIGGATGGMDRFDAIMRKIEPVIAGVGNVLVQFLLNPIKHIINAVEGLINVIDIFKEQGTAGFKDAFKEIGNTVERGAKIQMDSMNVVKNYEEAANKSRIESAKESTRKILKMHSDTTHMYIENMEAQKGADWKYTKDGITMYDSYFDSCLAMYEKDSEDYRKIQLQKWNFFREVEERKNKPKASAQPKREEPDTYLDDLKKVQKETEAIYKSTEEKQIEHYKNMAANTNTSDAIGFMEEAAKKESALQLKKNQEEMDALTEHHHQMQEKYRGNAERLAEINESFALQERALKERQANEKLELAKKQGEELRAIKEKVESAAIQGELERNDLLIAAQNKFIEDKKKGNEDLHKDQVKRNKLGLIDVSATKENYAKALAADQQYLLDLNISHLAKMKLLKEEQDLVKENSKEWKDIQDKMSAEHKNYADEKKETEDRITDNTEKSTNLQKEFYKELHDKMTETWGNINEALTSACEIANSIIQQQIDEAKVKLEEVTKQYDAVVEKRKECQDKIKSLEEEASSASGGRAIVIQEQIARQMEANQELAKQEQDLAKQKEKLEKDIAKKEKQAKKIELGQKLVQSIANTAFAVVQAMTAGPFIGQIMAALTAAAGAVQVAIITRQMSKLEDGGLLNGKRHSQGGMRIEGTNIEVEGDEFVVNRVSTRKNLGLIDYINKQRRELSPDDLSTYFNRTGKSSSPLQHSMKHMYEQGGQLTNLELVDSATAPDNSKILEAISQINFQPVVSVVDIASAQSNITHVKDIAGV